MTIWSITILSIKLGVVCFGHLAGRLRVISIEICIVLVLAILLSILLIHCWHLICIELRWLADHVRNLGGVLLGVLVLRASKRVLHGGW